MTDIGYWTGSITYQPAYSSSPFVISIGTGADSDGISWIWQSITGWDGPATVGSVQQRGSDQGGWATAQYFGPRAITVTLYASAPTQAARDLARNKLQQAIPVDDLATLVYNEPVPKQAYIRRTGALVEAYPTLTDVTFTCVLVAPDMRKYSTVLKTWPVATLVEANYMTIALSPAYTTVPFTLPDNVNPAMQAAENNGSIETRPTITIYGPLKSPAVRLQSTGQTVSWSSLTLNTGDVLYADFDARVAYYNPGFSVPSHPGTGQKPVSGYVPADITSSLFTLYPGYNAVELLSGNLQVTDAGQMMVNHRDAYI
jgi:hypothetical protein